MELLNRCGRQVMAFLLVPRLGFLFLNQCPGNPIRDERRGSYCLVGERFLPTGWFRRGCFYRMTRCYLVA